MTWSMTWAHIPNTNERMCFSVKAKGTSDISVTSALSNTKLSILDLEISSKVSVKVTVSTSIRSYSKNCKSS
jgi:hypothetical protein